MARRPGRRPPGSRPKFAKLLSANPAAGIQLDLALDDLEALYEGLPSAHAYMHMAFTGTTDRDGTVPRTLPSTISYGDVGSAGDPTLGLAAANHRHGVDIDVPSTENIPGGHGGFPFRTLQDHLDYLTAQAALDMSLTIVKAQNWR